MGGGSSIAAIATARGEAALAIVRVSGPDAVPIAARVFRGDNLADAEGHSVRFGRVVDSDGVALDEVVVTVFRAPRSSTGEDVVEFTCHGGEAVPNAVLGVLLDAGAELAGPGEFTRRAFLNGKLGLDQAEGIMDLIHARSEAAHKISMRQLRGRLKQRLSELRARLLEVCGLVELELDFIEEDVEFADMDALSRLLSESEQTLSELLRSAQLTGRWRDGISVVIAGKPNAGKSTLLNALVGHDRVIVSSTPGTTRDFVECELQLDGLLVKLVDTAGLRHTADEIEADGVLRTEALIASADVLVYVFDSVACLSDEEICFLETQNGPYGGKNIVLVANKADLLTAGLEAISGGVSLPRTPDASGSMDIAVIGAKWTAQSVSISARRAISDPEELEALLDGIRRAIPPELREFSLSDGMINERHRRHLADALTAVQMAQSHLASGSGGELISLELRSALDSLGAITGEITNEDVLGQIFSRFCIGK